MSTFTLDMLEPVLRAKALENHPTIVVWHPGLAR